MGMRGSVGTGNTGSMSRQGGFTIVELLVASAILVIIMGALVSFLVGSQKAYNVGEAVADRQQEIQSAVNVLSYDLSLAGYRGTTPTDAARTFSAPTLAVTKDVSGSGSDLLQIRYYEDSGRLFGGDTTCGSPCLVSYEVGTTGGGDSYLYRREGTASVRGIVQAVEYFKVIQFIKRDGSLVDVTSSTPIPTDLAALNIEIVFTNGGLWRFPVGLTNEQSN